MSGAVPSASQQQRYEAYKKVMRIFVAGAYDLAKDDALSTLRVVLAIPEDAHLRLRQEVREEMAAGSAQPSPSLGAGAAVPSADGSAAVRMASPFDTYGAGAGAGAGSKAAQGSKRAGGGAAPAADPRKRVKQEGGGAPAGAAGARRPAVWQRAPTPPGGGAPPAQDINPLIGRKVERNWPAQGGWFEGVISDYRTATGEHCIIYDIGKPSESYEWFRVTGATPQECRVKSETIDFSRLSSMASKGGSRKAGGGSSKSGTRGQQAAAGGGAAPHANGAAAKGGAAGAGAPAPAGAPRAARHAGAPGAGRPGSAAGAAKPLSHKQANARLAKMNSGITHAQAVQAALAAGGSQEQEAAAAARPPLHRNGFLDLPRRRRVRDWSSEEESSEEEDVLAEFGLDAEVLLRLSPAEMVGHRTAVQILAEVLLVPLDWAASAVKAAGDADGWTKLAWVLHRLAGAPEPGQDVSAYPSLSAGLEPALSGMGDDARVRKPGRPASCAAGAARAGIAAGPAARRHGAGTARRAACWHHSGSRRRPTDPRAERMRRSGCAKAAGDLASPE
eukprot:scaffold13.g334.t1